MTREAAKKGGDIMWTENKKDLVFIERCTKQDDQTTTPCTPHDAKRAKIVTDFGFTVDKSDAMKNNCSPSSSSASFASSSATISQPIKSNLSRKVTYTQPNVTGVSIHTDLIQNSVANHLLNHLKIRSPIY